MRCATSSTAAAAAVAAAAAAADATPPPLAAETVAVADTGVDMVAHQPPRSLAKEARGIGGCNGGVGDDIGHESGWPVTTPGEVTGARVVRGRSRHDGR